MSQNYPEIISEFMKRFVDMDADDQRDVANLIVGSIGVESSYEAKSTEMALVEIFENKPGKINPMVWGGAYPPIAAVRDVIKKVGCQCGRCLDESKETIEGFPVTGMFMVLCPVCGNKRCPHAADHRNACTGSNEPNQIPMSWHAVPLDVSEETVRDYKINGIRNDLARLIVEKANEAFKIIPSTKDVRIDICSMGKVVDSYRFDRTLMGSSVQTYTDQGGKIAELTDNSEPR